MELFPIEFRLGILRIKTLIHLVSVWSEYSAEWVMMLDVGRRLKNHLLYPLFPSFLSSTRILGCKEFRWPSTWLHCFPSAVQ